MKSLEIIDSAEGLDLLAKSRENTAYFQEKLAETNYKLATPSKHPIQPVLIGETSKTKKLVQHFYDNNILVTNISYPVVPKGRDEIRIQISATHTTEDIDKIIEILQSF